MENVVWHEHKVSRGQREKLLGQKAVLLWLTGLPSSGKSTIAAALQEKLLQDKKLAYILDGDNIRHGLNSDLDFSEIGRTENIRRIGEVAKLFVDAGIIIITAFISPYKKGRDSIRKKLENDFIEVFIRCPLEECEKRDPKGMFKKARSGEIKDFTGISAPYEEPSSPEITIDTSSKNVEESVRIIWSYLKERRII